MQRKGEKMKDNNRKTCLKCGADITKSSTHTLMDCIEHLRSENEILREQVQRFTRAAEDLDYDNNDQ
jgi:hypothetical protein